MNKQNAINENLKSLIVSISLLKHQRLTELETKYTRDNVEFKFEILDKLQVPFKLQNAALFIGEKCDTRNYYLNDLLKMVYDRAGIQMA